MTSLRQLLEILDILVKNEDFDSSRTMTTYLFTKPDAMKRFEFPGRKRHWHKREPKRSHLLLPASNRRQRV